MTKGFIIEAVALYLPICACLIVALLTHPRKELWIAGLMAFTWQIVILPLLNALAINAGWWEFAPSSLSFFGMPVSLYLGWAIFWSFLLTFCQESPLWKRVTKPYSIAIIAITLLIVDLLLMPLMEPILILNKSWIMGEALLIAIALLPAQLLIYAKASNTLLPYRAIHISLAFILLSLIILPALQPDFLPQALRNLRGHSPFTRSLFTIPLFLCALPGLSALQDFIVRGRGTPIPYDPPQRLVTTGVYGYCANPIQLSMLLVLIIWGIFTGGWVCYIIAGMSVIYSVGIAHWSEGRDMEARFGENWTYYRASAPSWRFRLTPAPSYPAGQLYIAKNCDTCSQLRRWFDRQHATNLTLKHAEDFSPSVLSRITYISDDHQAQGIHAIAEAFQHLNLTYAIIGWFIKLPFISHILQLAFDNSGAEPRQCRD